MKITPSKNHKKPLYAIGIAAALTAAAVSGCTNPFVKLAGETTTSAAPTETEVELDGNVAIEQTETKRESVVETITAGIVTITLDPNQ